MLAVVFGDVPSYFLAWVLAAIVVVPLATRFAVGRGFPFVNSLVAVLFSGACILVGSKGLFFLESILCPWDDYVPLQSQGLLHGFRIPGGIALVALAAPFSFKILGLPRREFADATIVAIPVLLVIVRIGCFLNGCCFGHVTSVPWAVSFPPGSWPYWYHISAGWLAAGAPHSLPTHPLQLYYALFALIILLLLLYVRQRQALPTGKLQLLFYLSFFVTSEFLEFFRENILILNILFLAVASAAALFSFVGPSRIYSRVMKVSPGMPLH